MDCLKNGRLLIAEFEAEERLRASHSFTLPALALFAQRNDLLLQGMDGLMITMAEEGDMLVTRVPLPPEYLQWWNRTFCNVSNVSPRPEPSENVSASGRESIYHLLQQDKTMHELLRRSVIVNYAAVPEYYWMCQALGIAVSEPDCSAAELLSRKSWAVSLRKELGLCPEGVCVSSVEAYDRCIKEMLARYGSVLVKDSMGVSGRGILPVEHEAAAERLSRHFHKQQAEGKQNFDFVIEPYLNRTMDFSSQLHIFRDGTAEIDGYQKNTGRGFGYRSSCGLSDAERNLIFSSGYPDTVRAIADAMAEAGYFGYACIDSMIADGDTVIPLLEINPRMSMGRFNLMLQKKTGKNCRLSYAEGTAKQEGVSETVLSDLDTLGLLYTGDRPYGVIPLAPAAWQRAECRGKRIRIYFALVYDTEEQYEKLLGSWLGYCTRCICAGSVT